MVSAVLVPRAVPVGARSLSESSDDVDPVVVPLLVAVLLLLPLLEEDDDLVHPPLQPVEHHEVDLRVEVLPPARLALELLSLDDGVRHLHLLQRLVRHARGDEKVLVAEDINMSCVKLSSSGF